MEEANLSGADLTEADLYSALIGGTNFTHAVLKGVAGLDHGIYFESSILDRETLMRSGSLPIEFLRGCGIPEHFINTLPDLLHRRVRYFNCFISEGIMVSAEGIESALKQQTKNLTEHSWHS